MTKSYVVYFEYDFYVHSVAKTKVKLENVENAKTADSCSVPFERVEIGEDGKEVNTTKEQPYASDNVRIFFFGVSWVLEVSNN